MSFTAYDYRPTRPGPSDDALWSALGDPAEIAIGRVWRAN